MSKEMNCAPKGWRVLSGAELIDHGLPNLDRIEYLPHSLLNKESYDPADIVCGCTQCEMTSLSPN